MKPLPEDQIDRKKVSLTDRIARVGVIIMISALFISLGIYGFLECDKAINHLNDVKVREEAKWKP